MYYQKGQPAFDSDDLRIVYPEMVLKVDIGLLVIGVNRAHPAASYPGRDSPGKELSEGYGRMMMSSVSIGLLLPENGLAHCNQV